MDDILEFTGKHSFLSNFWPIDMVHGTDGLVFPTLEHAYQSAKTHDQEWRTHIRDAPTPGEASRRGHQAPVRRDWVEIKLSVMAGLLVQKFAQEPLRTMLRETGQVALVEGSAWGDTFWGACAGSGENHLGKLLMRVRELVRGDQVDNIDSLW